jgi:hypothetical protein
VASKTKVLNLSILMALASLSLVVYKNTTSTFGWRQILGPGGVQPPSLLLSILVVFLFLLAIKYQQWNGHKFLIMLSAVGLGASVAIYSALTFLLTGSIQYYAIKQGLVFLGVASIFIIATVTRIQHQRIFHSFGNKSIGFMCSLWVIIFIFAFLNPKIYTGAFMGNVIQTTREVTTRDSWDEQIVDAKLILSLLNSKNVDTNSCQFVHLAGEEGDLNSRWLNALQPSNPMTQDCFMAFWNSTNLTLAEIYKTKLSTDTRYTIYVDNNFTGKSLGANPINVSLVYRQ